MPDYLVIKRYKYGITKGMITIFPKNTKQAKPIRKGSKRLMPKNKTNHEKLDRLPKIYKTKATQQGKWQ